MKLFTRFQYVGLILLLVNTGFTVGMFLKIKKPVRSETVVYKTYPAVPGPQGQTGEQGRPGLSLIGPPGATTYQPVPIYVQGQKADSCTVRPMEEDTLILCPDGTSTIIKSGKQGDAGVDGRTLEMRRNPDTGDVEQKYTDDSSWNVLIKACEYKGNCDGV